jgi:hypothetical protein
MARLRWFSSPPYFRLNIPRKVIKESAGSNAANELLLQNRHSTH